jgi:hypothetical protein
MSGLTSKAFLVLASSLALVFVARPARAFEREWHLGGGVGFASAASGYGLGPALGLHAAYGISDVFDARLELSGSHHGYEVAGADESTVLFAAAALLSYKVDIIAWVPHFGLGLGYFHFTKTPPEDSAFRRDDLGLALELGLDYAVSRNFGLGLGARFDMPFNDIGAARYFALLFRGEYRWGW